jgi:hypothetical protein
MATFTMLEYFVGFARYLKESRNPEIMRRAPIESAAARPGMRREYHLVGCCDWRIRVSAKMVI